jgi:hypothetical protein
VSLHGAPGHFELAGNLGVVAALQKQLNDLLFPRAQTNFLLRDQIPFHRLHSELWGLRMYLSICRSTHNATLRQVLAVTREHPFPQALADVGACSRNRKIGSQKQFGHPASAIALAGRMCKNTHIYRPKLLASGSARQGAAFQAIQA